MSRLSFINWAVICLTLSVFGSLLAVACFAILDGINFANPYFMQTKLEVLAYLIGYSLLINVLGSCALLVALAIGRRFRTAKN